MAELPSGTVTFLFTDIEASTRLVKELGDGYAAVLAEHQRLLREAFAQHGGHEIDTQGDSFFVAFRRARDAVAAAVAAQHALAEHEWPTGARVRVRMGLHSGEPAVGEDRYTGLGVHRAARVGAAGHGGQILLSETTRSLVEDDLPPGVRLRDLGRVKLKDIDRPERLSQLVVEGLPAAFPRPRSEGPPPFYRRRTLLAGALAGVIAAAVAIPLFALGYGSSGPGGIVVQGNSVAMIDPQTNRVAAEIPVGARPDAIAFGAGSLWVANLDEQTVSRIDPRSQQRLGSISFPDTPTGIAVTDGAVWAAGANATSPSVTVHKIDPQFDHRTSITSLGNVEYGGSGSVATARDAVWVAPSAGLLTKLDPRTGHVMKTIDPRSGVTAIAIGAGAVWIADADGNSVTRVDSTGLVTPIPVGNGPSALAVDGAGVWVAETLDNAVARIDPSTHAVTETIQVGQTPTGVAVGAGSVWVANSHDGTVTRIDEATNKPGRPIDVGGSLRSLTFADGRLWVTVDEATLAETEAASAGGTAHFTHASEPDSLDPAVAFSLDGWQILNATCVKVLNYPDKPSPAGGQLEPEAARSLPTLSDGGRTYTFRIRRGFRFSPPSHEQVTAQTFKFAIERSLSPKMKGSARSFLSDVVGADAYIAGKAAHVSGVVTHGDTLTIHLVRPAPDLLSRIALPFFCAVPLNTPLDPRGVRTIPAAGPYYVSAYTPGQGAVLVRNPNYSGGRPHHFDRMEIEFDVKSKTSDAEIEAGKVDYALVGVDPTDRARLKTRFGPGSVAAHNGRQQLFTSVSTELDYLTLNTTRGLFRNVRLRRAASLAVDRAALAADGAFSGSVDRVADGYLPPGIPGHTDRPLFPPHGDIAAARRLVPATTRTAVMYTCNTPTCARAGQIVKTDLARIGISVDVREFPLGAMFSRQQRPGEPFDIGLFGWGADYLDPADFLNYTLATPGVSGPGFRDPVFGRRLAAAALLSGPRRYLNYGRLATALARDSAPWIAFGNATFDSFFSARIGCQIEQPLTGTDLAALCLKKR
jgi:YVTN family beta-propeller protein